MRRNPGWERTGQRLCCGRQPTQSCAAQRRSRIRTLLIEIGARIIISLDQLDNSLFTATCIQSSPRHGSFQIVWRTVHSEREEQIWSWVIFKAKASSDPTLAITQYSPAGGARHRSLNAHGSQARAAAATSEGQFNSIIAGRPLL
jgi:hypothetical protein